MSGKNCLAFDLGASNGRAILGNFNGKKLILKELHRFINEPIHVQTDLYWNILGLYNECYSVLKNYSAMQYGVLSSVGFDSWGTDYGLIDKNNKLISNPRHYRDQRTNGIIEISNEFMCEKDVFFNTGNIPHPFNTVYQLLATKLYDSAQLEIADTLLLIPDLIAFFFTGVKSGEFTNVTTTQLTDTTQKSWNSLIAHNLGLPTNILPPIQMPGSAKGTFVKNLNFTHLSDAVVTATATHDTACAVAAIANFDEDSVYVSSGTWSLIGTETNSPVINEDVYDLGFSNEGGVCNKNTLFKQTMGMWVFQQCMKKWHADGENYNYEDIIGKAEYSEPFMSFIDTDNQSFILPGDMPQKIINYIKSTQQEIPQSPTHMVRIIMESLALRYRFCINNLEAIQGEKYSKIHVVGGGSKNRLLNQFIANALNLPVYSGPSEATSIGNIMVQFMALGEIKNLKEIRQVVSNSFVQEIFEPADTQIWEDAYIKYENIIINKKECLLDTTYINIGGKT